jgi:hypothetical protein
MSLIHFGSKDFRTEEAPHIKATMGNKCDSRPSTWRKPLFIVCIALWMTVPLFYFVCALESIFVVSKQDEPQVRKTDLVLGCELLKEHKLRNDMLLTPLNLYAFV